MPILPPQLEIYEDLQSMFIVRLAPRGKGRPRMNMEQRRTHTDDKTGKWKNDFIKLTTMWRMRNSNMIQMIWERPLYIGLALHYPRPKKPGWFCTNPVDNDNAEKNVFDAMQGLFFKNDNRIIANATFKDWDKPGEPGHIIIHIAALKQKATTP